MLSWWGVAIGGALAFIAGGTWWAVLLWRGLSDDPAAGRHRVEAPAERDRRRRRLAEAAGRVGSAPAAAEFSEREAFHADPAAWAAWWAAPAEAIIDRGLDPDTGMWRVEPRRALALHGDVRDRAALRQRVEEFQEDMAALTARVGGDHVVDVS